MQGVPITIFLPSLAGGGAERCMITIANGLAGLGADVTLATGTMAGPFRSEVDARVRLLDLRAGSAPRALPGLVRHLRSTRPVALLSAMSHANVVATLAHRLSGCGARLVLSERTHVSSAALANRSMRMRIVRALVRLTYARADCIIAVSTSVAEDLVRRFGLPAQRVTTIYNPVVSPSLVAKSGAVPSHPWFSQPGIPVVLAAGRLTPLKGFSTLIEAFAQLRRTRQLRLIILGEGELREALQEQARRLGIAEDVALPGFDPNPFAAMRGARVFVLSSRYEGLPGVLIQAMACGTRVVSTDCPGGAREVLEDGRWGSLVPVDDARGLAAAVAAALDDEAPADARIRAADFSEELAISRYAAALGLRATAPHHD